MDAVMVAISKLGFSIPCMRMNQGEKVLVVVDSKARHRWWRIQGGILLRLTAGRPKIPCRRKHPMYRPPVPNLDY